MKNIFGVSGFLKTFSDSKKLPPVKARKAVVLMEDGQKGVAKEIPAGEYSKAKVVMLTIGQEHHWMLLGQKAAEELCSTELFRSNPKNRVYSLVQGVQAFARAKRAQAEAEKSFRQRVKQIRKEISKEFDLSQFSQEADDLAEDGRRLPLQKVEDLRFSHESLKDFTGESVSEALTESVSRALEKAPEFEAYYAKKIQEAGLVQKALNLPSAGDAARMLREFERSIPKSKRAVVQGLVCIHRSFGSAGAHGVLVRNDPARVEAIKNLMAGSRGLRIRMGNPIYEPLRQKYFWSRYFSILNQRRRAEQERKRKADEVVLRSRLGNENVEKLRRIREGLRR